MSIESELQNIDKENKTLKWRLFFAPLVVFLFLAFASVCIAGFTNVAPIGIFFLIVFSLLWTKVAVKYESFWRGGIVNLGWYILISIITHSIMFSSYIKGMTERFPDASSALVMNSVLVWVVSKVTYAIPLLFISCLIARKVSGVKCFEILRTKKNPPDIKTTQAV